MDMIVKGIKEIADRESPKYITEHPDKVFRALAGRDGVDKKLLAAATYVLISGIFEKVVERSDAESLSKTIQRECSLDKEMADRLAEIFSSLYSPENIREWKEKNNQGLREFLTSEFSFEWEGFSVWRYSTGSISCHYSGTVTLEAEDEQAIKKEIAYLVEQNPFVTKEEICRHYERKLTKKLDMEFDDHCTCERYYEPVVEDFELDYYVKQWCRENGLRMIRCSGHGYDDGYEPDF